MCPANSAATTCERSYAGLPDGSYSKAAKILQTSGVSVGERLCVAESLLLHSSQLNPAPDSLVRHHTVYALSCKRSEFEEYRARYWRLLASLQRRASLSVPELVAGAAVISLRNGGGERDACIEALDVLLKSNSIRPRLEVLGELTGAALDCALESKSEQLHGVAVGLLVEYDDTQRGGALSRIVFSTCFERLVYPVLRSSGALRAAGEIVLRRGLIPQVDGMLQTKQNTYYDALFATLSNIRSCPHPTVLPELLAFLMQACRDAAYGRPSAQFPQLGRKRKANEVDVEEPVTLSSTGSTLPKEVAIPLRFLKDMLNALLKNIHCEEPEIDYSLPVLEKLLSTAAELQIYRPSFESSYARSSKNEKGEGKSERTPKDITVSSMISSLLSFISGKLNEFSKHGGDKDINVVKIENLVNCAKAIIRLAKDSIQTDITDLLESTLQCVGKQKSSKACSSLAGLVAELFQVYTSTRKVPELFEIVFSSKKGTVVMDEMPVLLSESSLQETIVDSIRTLPSGHAERCTRLLLSTLRTFATCSAFYFLSLIVEVVDFSTLKVIVPVLSTLFEDFSGSKNLSTEICCGLRFLYASLVSSLARDSVGPSSQLYRAFASMDTKLEMKLTKKIEEPDDMCLIVTELRMLAGMVHFRSIDCNGENERMDASGCLVELLRKFSKLPENMTRVTKSNSSRRQFTKWEHVLLQKGKSWAVPLLKIVSSVIPLLDYLVLDCDILSSDSDAKSGVKRLLSLAMSHVSTANVFWDSVLETRAARKYSFSCIVTLLKQKVSELETFNVISLIPKLSQCVLSAEHKRKLFSILNSMGSTLDTTSKLYSTVQRTCLCLQNQPSAKAQFEKSTAEKVISKSLNIMMEARKTILGGGGDVSWNDESIDNEAENVVTNLISLGSTRDSDIGDKDILAKLAVAGCNRGLFAADRRQGLYLQLICILATDNANEGVVGLCEILRKRVTGYAQQKRGDCRPLRPHFLERVIQMSTALSHGLCGGSADFDWAKPKGGISRSIERAARGASTSCMQLDLVFALAIQSVRAVSGALWRARRAAQSRKHAENIAATRSEIFRGDYERGEAMRHLWEIGEWAVAICGLAAERSGGVSQEQCELLLIALCELIGAGSESREKTTINSRARVQGGAIRAACLLARKSTLMLAALRCVRAALRSECLDANCARTISRLFEKVSGAPTVSALADTACALVRVSDAAVRGALEHGAAALIRQAGERGRGEALRSCDDEARDVLRALVEIYKQDFEYGRI